MKFTTKLMQGDAKNVVGIVVPPEVVAALGAGKRPPVTVTINGYTYRNTIAVMGELFMVGVAAEHRREAKVSGGDTVEVDIQLDAAPRTVDVPPDLAKALADSGATAAFAALSFTYRKEHVRSVNDAKAPETRLRRIQGVIDKVSAAAKS